MVLMLLLRMARNKEVGDSTGVGESVSESESLLSLSLLLSCVSLLFLLLRAFEKSDEDDDDAEEEVQRVSDEGTVSESLLSFSYSVVFDSVGDDSLVVGCDDDGVDVSIGILVAGARWVRRKAERQKVKKSEGSESLRVGLSYGETRVDKKR